MSFKISAWYIISFIFGLLIGYSYKDNRCIESTTTTIDSIRYVMPKQYEVKTTEIRTFSIPKLVFAPSDTICVVNTKYIKNDSVRLDFQFERREYKDSTFRATVSGVVVGDVHPTLESIDVYSTTVKTTLEKKKLFSPYGSLGIGNNIMSIGVGVVIREKHGVGVEYVNIGNENNLTFKYAYYF